MNADEPFTLSKGRFESFSDGVFAVAITLLVFGIHLPAHPGGAGREPSQAQQIHDLVVIWPQYLVYGVSFFSIGIMWLNHHALFRFIERITPGIVVANLLLLVLIAFLPFPTGVLAILGLTPVAVVFYGLTMVAISIAYNIVYQRVLAAHPSVERKLAWWTIIGMTAYPAGTIVGYFVPLAGILVFAGLALFYLHPANIRGVVIRP